MIKSFNKKVNEINLSMNDEMKFVHISTEDGSVVELFPTELADISRSIEESSRESDFSEIEKFLADVMEKGKDLLWQDLPKGLHYITRGDSCVLISRRSGGTITRIYHTANNLLSYIECHTYTLLEAAEEISTLTRHGKEISKWRKSLTEEDKNTYPILKYTTDVGPWVWGQIYRLRQASFDTVELTGELEVLNMFRTKWRTNTYTNYTVSKDQEEFDQIKTLVEPGKERVIIFKSRHKYVRIILSWVMGSVFVELETI